MGFGLFDDLLHGELRDVSAYAVVSVHHYGYGGLVDHLRVRVGLDVAVLQLVSVDLEPGHPVGGDPPGVGLRQNYGGDPGLAVRVADGGQNGGGEVHQGFVSDPIKGQFYPSLPLFL